jgi:hypothetical protein
MERAGKPEEYDGLTICDENSRIPRQASRAEGPEPREEVTCKVAATAKRPS